MDSFCREGGDWKVRLKELRERARMTQKEMAKLMGKSERQYSRWESAKDPKIPLSKYAILREKLGL
jgi:transcriptional regulator with XRE-family HTH domain